MLTTSYPIIEMEKTGKNLKDLRESRKIKVSELSSFLLVSPQAIYKWERGEALPSLDNAFALTVLYGVDFSHLIIRQETETVSYFFALFPLTRTSYSSPVIQANAAL